MLMMVAAGGLVQDRRGRKKPRARAGGAHAAQSWRCVLCVHGWMSKGLGQREGSALG